jgi:hypothetical protein
MVLVCSTDFQIGPYLASTAWDSLAGWDNKDNVNKKPEGRKIL